MNDLKFAFRQLLKNPGFTAVAVLTLALGIGANTAIFSLVDAVLLQSLPVREPERLFFLSSGNNPQICYPLIDQFQRSEPAVGPTFAYRSIRVRINAAGRNDIALGQLVTGNFFSALGVQTALGRAITKGDDQAGAPPVAVISDRCWRQRVGSDPAIVGKRLDLNGIAFTVIGVTPREFYGMDAQAVPEAFVPVRLHALLDPGEPRLLEEYGNWVFSAVVRLNPGVAEEAARARLTALYQQVVSASAKEWIRPETLPELLARGMRLEPAAQGVAKLREKFTRPLLMLMGASGLVLLVACGNVANLLLARGAIRQRELAVRLAVGADRGRLLRLVSTESLVLAGLGSVIGVLFANWTSQGLMGFLPEEAAGIALQAGLNARQLGFSALTACAAALLFGLVPALRASRLDPNVVLGGGGRASVGGRGISHLAKWLVSAQVAFSVILLIGAGLFIRSLRELVTLDPGFRRENVLLLTVQPKLTGYSNAPLEQLSRRLASAEALDQLEAIPGVRSASLSASRQFGDRPWWRMPIKLPDADGGNPDRVGAVMRWVTPKHFETFGIPVLRGRPLQPGDNAQGPKVAVINQSMARQYFGEKNPIGQRFKLTSGLEALGEFQVVGVAKDTKAVTLRENVSATFYIPFAQFPNSDNLVFALRTTGQGEAVANQARRELEALDPNLAISDISKLSSLVDASLLQERALATLAGGFGALALVLAAIGLYGVLACAVSQRTREIGLRLALGAQRHDVLRLIAGQGMKWVGIGILGGVAGALALSRLLTGFLFGIEPTDPATFGSVSLLLITVAIIACWLPARRAANVDPMEALRNE